MHSTTIETLKIFRGDTILIKVFLLACFCLFFFFFLKRVLGRFENWVNGNDLGFSMFYFVIHDCMIMLLYVCQEERNLNFFLSPILLEITDRLWGLNLDNSV